MKSAEKKDRSVPTKDARAIQNRPRGAKRTSHLSTTRSCRKKQPGKERSV